MAKILIVDDDPGLVEIVKLHMEREGHDVDTAYNRDEGMELIKKSPPDLLILDVMMEMPDDGIALAQELKRGGFSAPILMMSSIGKVTGLEYDKDSEAMPVNDFVEKPVAASVLIEKVNALLGK